MKTNPDLNKHFLTVIINNKSIYHYHVRDFYSTTTPVIGVSNYNTKKGWYLNRKDSQSMYFTVKLDVNAPIVHMNWEEFNNTYNFKNFKKEITKELLDMAINNLIAVVEKLRWEIIENNL